MTRCARRIAHVVQGIERCSEFPEHAAFVPGYRSAGDVSATGPPPHAGRTGGAMDYYPSIGPRFDTSSSRFISARVEIPSIAMLRLISSRRSLAP